MDSAKLSHSSLLLSPVNISAAVEFLLNTIFALAIIAEGVSGHVGVIGPVDLDDRLATTIAAAQAHAINTKQKAPNAT